MQIMSRRVIHRSFRSNHHVLILRTEEFHPLNILSPGKNSPEIITCIFQKDTGGWEEFSTEMYAKVVKSAGLLESRQLDLNPGKVS